MNRWQKTTVALLMGSLAVGPFVGCESLPGNDEQQGAVIGGVGGALAGAAVAGSEDRLLGALIGGALGAGGGYLIGGQWDKITGDDKDKSRDEAIAASKKAERDPARPSDVDNSRTADLNDDGFVTLDEVVAMEEADLSDREMITRLERTQQYFELTSTQEDYLRDRGVSDNVIVAMRDMNPKEDSARLASDRDDSDARNTPTRSDDRYDSVGSHRPSDRD
jgi:hypothetical protein